MKDRLTTDWADKERLKELQRVREVAPFVDLCRVRAGPKQVSGAENTAIFSANQEKKVSASGQLISRAWQRFASWRASSVSPPRDYQHQNI